MILKPCTGKKFKGQVYGFDVETYGRTNKFYMGSIYGDEYRKLFYSIDEFISFLRSGKLGSCILCATNLGFDFFSVFLKRDSHFNFLFRGSELLCATTYLHMKKFYNKRPDNKRCVHKIEFIDTMNYARMSVKKLGEMIGIPKLKKPASLGRIPLNLDEKRELETYNIQDSKISFKALQFFYKTFESLGATPKLTLSSTAMSLFRNKYLDNEYYRHPIPVLLDIFEGYYGGRTEALCRGRIDDYNYYDFNSLYPAMMLKKFPDPNTLRTRIRDSIDVIMGYEGMSKVSIYCPFMPYPLLPYRHDNKLLFPTGSFRGWYTHTELRRALELGYVISRVYKSHYYLKTCEPFKEYVNDMYSLRMQYKQDKSSMEKVVKILLNGLYGKFGQKFMDKDNIIPLNHTALELAQYKYAEILDNNYVRIKEDRKPALFCIPIWASYVTAYGRILLHEFMMRTRPVYVDTDSLITKMTLPESTKIGELKLEKKVKYGIIVKPKFYMVDDDVKLKGCGRKLVCNDFIKLMVDPRVKYKKFVKFRESIRRGLICNEILEVSKEYSLNDDKREWYAPFDDKKLGHSTPKHLNNV